MNWVVGFDLSLTAPAACALPFDWKPGHWKRAKSWLLKPKPPASDDLRGQMHRYADIASWAMKVVGECGGHQAVVFVEGYGYSKNNANASKIMENGGIVKHMVYQRWGALIRPVAQNTARKLLLGKMPAPVQKKPYVPLKRGGRLKKPPEQIPIKVLVQDVLFNKLGAPKGWDENQADAFVVVNWGLSEVGGRCLTLAR